MRRAPCGRAGFSSSGPKRLIEGRAAFSSARCGNQSRESVDDRDGGNRKSAACSPSQISPQAQLPERLSEVLYFFIAAYLSSTRGNVDNSEEPRAKPVGEELV